ncbi:hypothetical protein PF008_g30900, partial [Phytophthora fragariae]
MVLSVKKTLALALCASTLAAFGVSALRPHPRRALSGIHHTTNGDGDLDVDLGPGEGLDYGADGDQDLDLSSSGDLDFSADARLDASGELETEIQFEDGSVDLELDDSEQELEDDQVVDEVIEEPEGAKSIRLCVNNCNVDLDIIKGVKPHDKKAAAQPEQKKEEAATAPTETKE